MLEEIISIFQPIGNIVGVDLKQWTNEQIDKYVADIKKSIGTFYTFESAIYEIKQAVSKGQYDTNNANEIYTLLSDIETRQKKLQVQVDSFVNLTGGAIDKYGNFEFNKDYLKANWDSLITDGGIIYVFLTSTMSEIDKQEEQINKIKSLLKGSSPLMYNLKEFFSKPKNIFITLGGVWLVKKILK